MKTFSHSDLMRALRIIALANDERLKLIKQQPLSADLEWFLKNIDRLAPELKRSGWIQLVPFNKEPGGVCATNGAGEMCSVLMTEAGSSYLLLRATMEHTCARCGRTDCSCRELQ